MGKGGQPTQEMGMEVSPGVGGEQALGLRAQTWTGKLLLVLPFFFWGTAMVAMKGALAHTTPFFVAGVRLVPAGLLVLLVALGRRRPFPLTWQAWSWILGFALVDGALFQGFLAQGLTLTSAGLGSVMIDSQPLAVAVMARLFYGEQIGVLGWLGLLVGVVGISVIGIPELVPGVALPGEVLDGLDNFGAILGQVWESGEWWMLLAALSMAVGTVMMRRVSQYADPLMATGLHMVIGGLPLFAMSAGLEVNQWNGLTGGDWLALAYSTVFGSAIAYGLFFYFAAQGNLTSLSALTFLTSVFALVFGGILLSEVLNPVQGVGVLLTLVSVTVVNQRERLRAWIAPSEASILKEES